VVVNKQTFENIIFSIHVTVYYDTVTKTFVAAAVVAVAAAATASATTDAAP